MCPYLKRWHNTQWREFQNFWPKLVQRRADCWKESVRSFQQPAHEACTQNQICFEWAGGESLRNVLWNSLTLGQGLELTPEQFCAEAWAVCHTQSKSLCVSWTYWNTLSRCNGPHSSGIKIMPAHISKAWRGSLWQEAKDIGCYQRSWHFKAERDLDIS